MSDDKKPTRRNAAKFRKALDEVEGGKDVVAIASGAKDLVTFEEVLNNHAIAQIFAVPKNKVGGPTKYDPTWMLDKIIEGGRLGGSKDKMAAMIGVHLDTLYDWAEKHAEFSEALKKAVQLSKVWWENFGQVSALGMVDGFNSTTWIFNMKNRFPETYRDVKVTELNNIGAPLIDARSITINARELDPEYRQSLKLALLAAKRAVEGGDDD